MNSLKIDSAYVEVMAILNQKIKECEQKANNYLTRQKYIVFNYHRAVAMHLRKVKRHFEEIQKSQSYNPESSRTYGTKRLYLDYFCVLEDREIVLLPPKPTLPRS